ncbi:helix-turn-helix domain-containing protein [Anoxybacillus kestanbolensis]|nr:helix-turn-helix domain-containing protein [Anoxybacillus kestanbolensis]
MLKIEDRGHMVLIWENLLDWYDEESETLYDSAPIQFENGRIEVICEDFIAIEKEEGFVLYVQNSLGEVEEILSTDGYLMSTKEAAERWGIDESYIRRKINEFPPGTTRKFGKQWVVTKNGMNAVFGQVPSLQKVYGDEKKDTV